MTTLSIRPAREDDTAVILAFIRELAAFEREPDAVVATEAMMREALFAPGATTHAIIAESGDGPIGFAVYFYSFSTWQGRRGLYLEDLYVSPAARGAGVGKALLKALAGIAVAEGCGRFEWSVLDWNESAIRVYDAVGGKPQREWIRYRLEGESLEALARG